MFSSLTGNWLPPLRGRKRLPLRRNKKSIAFRPAFEALEDRCLPSITVLALSTVSGSTSGGTVVQISGTGFAGATAVNFGAMPATAFVVNSDNGQAGGALITATAPAEAAGTVDVTVTVAGTTSSTSPADQFTYEGTPTGAYRPIDEVGNNILNPTWGTAGSDLLRLSPAEYGNGVNTPTDIISFTGTTTSGSDQITNASNTIGLAVGQQIIGTNIPGASGPPGTTITAINGSTITISQAATGTGTVSLAADAGPPARVVSDILNNQTDPLFPPPPSASAQDIQTVDQNSLTDFGYAWGQFIDHDMDLTPTNDGDFLQILADPNDPSEMGDQTFELSAYNPTTGTSTSNPLQQINAITSYLDLSNVYGSTPEVADALRTFSGGLLKTSPGNLLPYNNLTYVTQAQLDALNMANSSQEVPNSDLFAAGDVRANENVELTALQTLFVRNHNLIATELAKDNPHDFGFSTWTDQELYEEARKINIAEEQYITYTQYLPDLLGPNALPAYTGYNPNVNASIATEFSTVAFRFGHSLLSNTIHRDNNSGQNLLPNDPVSPTIDLADDFFDPTILNANGSFTGNTTSGSDLITNVSNTTGLAVGDQIIGTDIPAGATITAFTSNTITISQDATGSAAGAALNMLDPFSGQIPTDIGPILKGDADGAAQADDLLAVNEIRDLLFANGGLQDNGQDLIARDVERARVDGIGSYNQVRVALGLAPVTSFSQISSNPQVVKELEEAYPGGVNTVDAFEGGLAENHVPGSDMGQLFTTILVNQFTRLRSGDRFFYLNETWNQDELNIFRQGDTLAKIIEANTSVTNLQSDVFIFQASISGQVTVSLGSSSRPVQVGVPGITVELTDTSGDVLATTRTDIFGRYSFNQLSGPAANATNAPGVSATGDYQVVVVLPSFLKETSGPGTIEITRGGTNVTGADFDLSLTGPLSGMFGQEVTWMFGQAAQNR
jgi:peroxidase